MVLLCSRLNIYLGVPQAAHGPGYPLQSFFSCLKKSISAPIPHATIQAKLYHLNVV